MGSSNAHYSSPSSSIMDPGSISLTDSGTSPSSPLLHGLKFGRKIYFEDYLPVPLAPPAKPARPSSSSSTSPSSKKGRGASADGGGRPAQGGQPPRCQVEGCRVDLSDFKAYYSRHKVCGMHSKSPKVVVRGIEQRFCQQCSRSSCFFLFHELAEFDEVKRSCRRRLTGHNERRRKHPPGTLLPSGYGGRLSSSVFEDTRGFGSFMNFSAYPRHLTRDVCSPPQLSDRGPASQVIGNGKFHLNHPWQQSYSPSAPPPSFFLQGSSASGVCSSFTSSGVPPGECHAGVSADSTCALSLLSNQPQPRCSSRSQTSDVRVNEMLPNHENVALSCASPNHFPDYASWDFKASYDSGIQSDLGLCQFSRLDSHFSGEVELSQQIRRQYAGLNNSRAFEASWLVDWPL